MQLKISNITSLSDARYFSAIGANYLGYSFDVLDENNISIPNAKEIIQWLHEPVIVGEFGSHQTKEEIEFIAQNMELNEIQIPFEHKQKDDFLFDKFIKITTPSLVNIPNSTDSYVLYIQREERNNKAVRDFISTHKVFLAIDLTNENSIKTIELLQPFGIQISCKKEEKAGFSYVDEYTAVLEKIGYL